MQIPSDFLREARRLFGRLRHSRGSHPLFAHVLATFDIHGITLAVTDGDHWLETYRYASPEPGGPHAFLISAAAMAAACRADRGTPVELNPRGPRTKRELRVTVRRGWVTVESVHPTAWVGDFPSPAAVVGTPVLIPARTLESLSAVAGCASTDERRPLPNGVAFTPEDGGRLIATDGGRFACVPAIVPPRGFVLPNAAVRVLTHPDFRGYENEITVGDREGDPHAMFRAWDHLLVAGLHAVACPDFKQVIPEGLTERITLGAERREAIVSWLRFLPDARTPVRLRLEPCGHLTLTRRSGSNPAAVLRVPVRIHGHPPAVEFLPRHLADALEIGSTLWLRDDVTPVLFRDPDGGFCLLTPVRCPVDAATSSSPLRLGTSEAA